VSTDQHTADVDLDARALLDAITLITSDLDLHGALDRLVQAACQLAGAAYGALGLLDAEGNISDFVIQGLDEETKCAIGAFPTSQGLLGVLVDDPRPMRLENLNTHARALGFPPNHPPMSTFLGVPIRVQGVVYGNLYLTEKRGGVRFTDRDEALLVVLAQVAGFVIGTAQSSLRSQRRQDWLEASLVLTQKLEDSDDVGAALGEIAAGLLRVADARLVVMIGADGEVIAVEQEEGLGDAEVDSRLTEAGPVVADAMRLGEVVIRTVADRTWVVTPMSSRLVAGHAIAALVAAPTASAAGPDAGLFTTYVGQASLALDRAQGLSERQELMLVADRDRIARDLHDTVIQRIFATALQLQGLRRTVLLDEVKVRLDEAVGELNTTIRDIRSSIFELRRDDASTLKNEVRGLAREYVQVLGFTPFVRLRGPLDDISREVADHLLATLREALSNVARHADADACVVEVEVTGERLTLRVSDNGRGISEMAGEGGLRNVRLRAMDLGGKVGLRPEDPHGTMLEWTVPLG
jgi:signal transduction histidine kinase